MVELIDKIQFFKGLADPELSAFQRLKRLEEKVQQNVMLMPVDMRFLNELQAKLDNIECINLGQSGGCKHPQKVKCEHLEAFRECPYYGAQKGQTKGNPLSALQEDQ